MNTQIADIFADWNRDNGFSGVFMAQTIDEVICERACGFRNRGEELPNNRDTALGIASGTKLFTELAACKLIDEGKLSLDDRIGALLPYDLKRINPDITVKHLLTHSSGIGDYIDEEASSDYQDMMSLYNRYPVYHWNSLAYYLPMFSDLPPKFSPGERYGYSNAGFVLLGLVIESASGMDYHSYVSEAIIRPCRLSHTGYYRMDRLPGNTALGYTQDASGQWYTNIFCMPAIGGADGGIFSSAPDLHRLWRCILDDGLFSERMKADFFTPQITTVGEGEFVKCGLGVFVYEHGEKTAYFAVGGDFGVAFFTAYFPRRDMVVSALGNTEKNSYPLLMRLCEELA